SAAESDAAAADRTATNAESDAVKAEKAASNAENSAKEADAAATRAEAEERERERKAAQALLEADGSGAGADLTADDESLLLDGCGPECVEEFREARALTGQGFVEWIKANGAEILLEYIGVNDVKRCFNEGDVESCLWTLVNAVSVAIPVLKFPAVAKAVVRVARGITGFLEKSVTAKRTLDRMRTLIKDIREGKVKTCPVKPKALMVPSATGLTVRPSSAPAPAAAAEYPGVGTIVSQDGVRIQIYSNDHAPAHAHVKGKGDEVRIGQNGKPLAGDPELSRHQQAVVTENIRTIRENIRVAMERFKARGC
ncbi:DUF4160 domain-containing protein, partial [Streptomyces sp. SID5470]